MPREFFYLYIIQYKTKLYLLLDIDTNNPSKRDAAGKVATVATNNQPLAAIARASANSPSDPRPSPIIGSGVALFFLAAVCYWVLGFVLIWDLNK